MRDNIDTQSQDFDPSDYPSLDIALQEAKEAVDEQINEIDVIDDKVGTILGFTGIIFSVIVGTNIRTMFSLWTAPNWSFYLLLGAIFFVILSISFNVWAYRVKDYSAGPEPIKVEEEYAKKDTGWVKAKLLAIYVEVYMSNGGTVKTKTKFLRLSTYFLFTGLFLIAIRFSYKLFLRCL